jgi:hypothetical protein
VSAKLLSASVLIYTGDQDGENGGRSRKRKGGRKGERERGGRGGREGEEGLKGEVRERERKGKDVEGMERDEGRGGERRGKEGRGGEERARWKETLTRVESSEPVQIRRSKIPKNIHFTKKAEKVIINGKLEGSDQIATELLLWVEFIAEYTLNFC